MKERPILFSQPMVRAILAGQKTQTRRVVKPTQSTPKVAPLHMEPYLVELSDGSFEQERDEDGLPMWIGTHPDYPTEYGKWFSCPYGQPGDKLWVRETWINNFDVELKYKADYAPGSYEYDAKGWKSPYHLHRKNARLFLELTNVRVERLQDISEADAQAEGVAAFRAAYCSQRPEDELTAIGYYELLWDQLNKARGYGWDVNPWVWVLTFEQVK